tara:strand:- start:305 stop:607 length:303 start_codon:yes stop_codon:yes gene_type:complete
MNVGQTVGNIGGTIAGGALLGALDGPLPFMDIIGAGIGGAIGGDIGKAIGGKGKRMAGEMFQYSPLAMAGLMESMKQANPNTQGLGLVDPNPQINPYAMY